MLQTTPEEALTVVNLHRAVRVCQLADKDIDLDLSIGNSRQPCQRTNPIISIMISDPGDVAKGQLVTHRSDANVRQHCSDKLE